MTFEEMKEWINNADIRQLLKKWRFAPSGSEWFQGEIGKYYAEVMQKKRDEDNNAYVSASKSIGWDQ